MKAAVLIEPKKIEIREFEIPEPKSGELRIKLTKIGICGSDVHVFLGHRLLANPTIIGHEGIGIIDKFGDGVSERIIGERIVIEPNIPCQNCKHCSKGKGNICPNKRVLGINEAGCFAEYICVPTEYCWQLPHSISDNDAVCIEPTAVALSALSTASCKPGDSIAVIGLGAIGLLLTHIALAFGYKVWVTDIVNAKLKIATDMGAIAVAGEPNQLNEIWENNDVVAVFECAGSALTASLATAAAPRGSEIILLGLSEKPATFIPLKIAREGIRILPSIIYDHATDFKKAIELIESKIISPGFIISSFTSLEKVQLALELASEGNESKIVVEI
jgi:L-iditol 2-dehydrogenase